MSRSYKKTPLFCDRDPFMKRYYNRVIRRKRLIDIPNGGHYRKMNCPWAICDYKFGCYTRGEVLRETRKEGDKTYPYYRYFMK